MPYIKKIELKGFKSFGPKTATVKLDKGFTAITGPNGSGKTNIADAVLFGLGELSARRMRAASLSKLIYHGYPDLNIKQAKTAKIVLQFDNLDNRLPVDTQTVTISRELNRAGQSLYRLNGRRISRAHILNILSMAGISPTGHNVVLQHTLTRLAEISAVDRRKMISDLVGIAQYDAEKAEAENKLRAAEISIRTAMGRIDEVQKRVDDLERERNELLRYMFLKKEIKRFEAMKIFGDIAEIEKKKADVTAKIEAVRSKVEDSRQLREKLRSQRYEVESEWRKLGSEMIEERGTRLLEVQYEIGEARSKISELTTKIGAGEASVDGLRKVIANNEQKLEAIQEEIKENRTEIRRAKREHEKLQEEISEKQAQYNSVSNEASQLRATLGDKSRKIKEIEETIEKRTQELVELRSDAIQSRTSLKVLTRQLNELVKRRDNFEANLKNLKKSYSDLKTVQNEQVKSSEHLEKTIERRLTQRESVQAEIVQAEKIAESARDAVLEFATQRDLAEKVVPEENARRNIEELADLGAIKGVYGRLKKLIRVEKGYRRAVQATAAGWLDAIVVQNYDAAFMCAETLKRMKLGRIKIIPIDELSDVEILEVPNITEVEGIAAQFVRCAKKFEPAVRFVFGDTVIFKRQKSAFNASREGYRTVSLNGDLYEAQGGIESGYYRAPVDYSTIIPSKDAVKSLDQAIDALHKNLTKRKSDITGFKDEIERTKVELARLSETIVTIDGEIGRVRQNVKHARQNIKRIEQRVSKITENRESEKTQLGILRQQRNELKRDIDKLREELADLRMRMDPARIQEMEMEREKIGNELMGSRQVIGNTETNVATLQSKFDNILKVGADSIRIQLRKMKSQIVTVEQEIEEATHEKENLEKKLVDLEQTKEALTKTVLNAKQESKKYTVQLDDLNKRLQELDSIYERSDRLYNELHFNLQTSEMQLQQHNQRLTELGYNEPMEIAPDQLQNAESSLKLLRFELNRLGAVNQLSLDHYAEQASRYKELSVRMNELEKEKQSILLFMEEIERKKKAVFMEAFEKIDTSFRAYFSKLTGGGEAALLLENPEDPFAGGMDMQVQFRNKASILVSGASSGERSVSTVAFIFALQDFMPTAFYVFDEIDAHLDPFHVSRLGDLFVELSEKSQFVVITLKPEMVSKAKKVWGIYERSGYSHVVTAKMQEATA
ncbi:MAG: AAA family ATPase [Candidatus Bathyarchaeota archaeon]|nr:AAA family ATPase [Candidatus Bathyarchaeota archaeon]